MEPSLILSAGTSDLAVAEEARLTALALGNRVKAIQDVALPVSTAFLAISMT